jgi:hypothetical protein
MKGFMFSIDSLMTIGLILLAATTLWVTVYEKNNTELISPKLNNSEMMTLYFNEPAKENILTNQNQKCSDLYYYNSLTTKQPTPAQTMDKKTICEGTQ